MNKKFFKLFISLMVVTMSGQINAEVYKIDAATVKKEILPGGYKMGTATNPEGIEISANNYYLTKGGKPWFPIMGEIHYSRYPRHMWEDAILKMKNGGITCVATYSFWIHHEEIEGEFDFSGQRDLRAFIELCKKHDMPVVLRLGPWCHGEVKNGGHPDWIYKVCKPGKTRTNDPTYLKYATSLYKEYYKHSKGLFYKDGGPVIGLQIENEYSGAEHLLELKRIAVETGFDLPLYTVTGWNNVIIPDKEALPVQAGYADAPWAGGTQQLEPEPQFLFKAGIPINTGVGTDVLPVVEVYGKRTYDPSDYPWLTAELGLGVQVTQRRHPVITHQDAVSLMTIKLAGGANALGYYMYHGGTNPKGKVTELNEPGTPVKSYDFQCGVGEYGETYSKYHEMKLVHYWLKQYGSQLCKTVPAMPAKIPSGVKDVDTLRCMTRTDETSGYFFFSNYQRYVPNKDLGPVQVSVKLKNGTVNIPSEPITIPKDTSGIWPINLKMADINLNYATAQLIGSISSDDTETYFFFAQNGIIAEYAFDPQTVKEIKGGESSKKVTAKSIQIKKPGFNSVINLISKSGKKISICTLTKKQAMTTNFVQDLWGKTRVVVAEGDVLYDGNKLDLRRLGQASGEVRIYPSPQKLKSGDKQIKLIQDGIFALYQWSLPEKKVKVKLTKLDETSFSLKGLNWVSASPTNWLPIFCFRKTMNIPDINNIKAVKFVFRADDYLKLWVNNKKLGSKGSWDRTTMIDLTDEFKTGKNVIACSTPNSAGPGGLVGQLIITNKNNNISSYPIDQTWKASHKEVQNWEKINFDDSKWVNAVPIKEFGKESWETEEKATIYSLELPSDSLDDVYDVYLDVNWQGNILHVSADHELIADWIYYGPHFKPSLRHWGKDVFNKKLQIEIDAITPKTKCYIEPEYRLDFSKKDSIAEIKKITPIAQYRIVLTK